MEATKMLMEEHRVIERVLDSLEAGARRLAVGESMRPGFFLDAADFIQGFADGRHHTKEEGLLFPAMEAAGIPRQGGPIGVMLAEHEEARQLTREMRSAAVELEKGGTSARDSVARNARAYVALLRQHILKEDNVLFPMADSVIRGEKQLELAAGFVRIDQDEIGETAHRESLAMAQALEREAEG